MDSKLKKNYVYNLLGQLLTIIIPVITTPYVSRVLGAKAIGDFGYTTGIVSYFCMIAMLGTANYAQREIARRHESKNEVSCIFFEILSIRIIMTLIVFICYLFFLNLPSWRCYRTLFSVQAISFVAWGFDISWLFQGLEQFKVTAIRNSIVKIVSTILILSLVKRESDLVLYTIIYCLSDLIGNITMWPSLKGNINKVCFSKLKLFCHFKGVWELFIPNIALQLYTVFDKTMLGSLVDTLQVGYYSQAEKIIKIILVAISSLFTVLLPRFSYLSNQHGDVEANRYFVSAIKYTYFIAIPLTIGCICVSDYFVPLFFGLGYDAVSPLMKILAVLFIVMSIEKLLGTILIAYSKQNIYTTSVVAASIINITLNLMFILVFQLDAIGVAIASVIAEFVAMLIQLFNLPTCFHKYSVLMASKNYIVAGIGMAVTLMLINIVPMGAVGHLAVSILLGAAIYFSLLLIIKDDMVVNVLKDFIIKLRR